MMHTFALGSFALIPLIVWRVLVRASSNRTPTLTVSRRWLVQHQGQQ